MCHNQECNVNKTPFIQIQLFTAEKNDGMKQSACVNYTLKEFKLLCSILGDFRFVDNCKIQ